MTGIELLDIDTYNNGVVSGKVKVSFKELLTGVERWVKPVMSFKKVNNNWVLAGDGKIAWIKLRAEYEREHRADGSSVYRKSLKVKVDDYMDNVSSVKIYGPGINSLGFSVTMTCENGVPTAPQYACYSEGAIREFGENYYWEGNDMPNLDLTQAPYVGAVYTIRITKTDNTTVDYKVAILPAPDNFAYPEFRNLNPNTHNLTFTNGKMTITGEVFVPLFVDEIPAPFVNLWDGTYNSNWGTNLGDVDCTWTQTPQVGQYNPFSCEIPEIQNGYNVTIAILGGEANTELLGGTKAIVYWDLSK